ncbi:hypothetical protein D3C73_1254010 [compost metagenome]
MAAHAQIAGVVEEDHPGTGAGVHRLAEQRADQHIAAPWFEYAGGPPVVVLLGKDLAALGHAAIAQFRKTGGHQAGGFAAGVGIDHADAFHEGATLAFG